MKLLGRPWLQPDRNGIPETRTGVLDLFYFDRGTVTVSGITIIRLISLTLILPLLTQKRESARALPKLRMSAKEKMRKLVYQKEKAREELRPLTSECRAAKLFSKHMKIEEQASSLKNRVNIASGTPSRIKKLIDMEALGLSGYEN
ncbi:hypothetical protein RND71_028537 [Anisodus tanguticus]|uniref:Uncharacterized protein n=1 Tax=Anisodus tanguticus TaxID=243964 RepID=A0AAE1V996_9SOLA|nr:hypothetical protein RND71_028537 [Anisodus tanguticus]